MKRSILFLAAMLLALAGGGRLATPALASTVTVCPTSEAELQSAVSSAGAGGTVSLQCATPTTISFTSQITLDQSVTLTASGSAGTVTFDGGGRTSFFTVDSGASLSLANLTLTHGNGPNAGAITNLGTLTITDSTFSSNLSFSNTLPSLIASGAIGNNGTLTISNSTFSGNSGSVGGAIFSNSGTSTITNSTFSRNTAQSTAPLPFGEGGAIDNSSTLAITNSAFSDNSAASGGGAIENSIGGKLTITSSTLSGNLAAGAGAIDNKGTLDITSSTLSDNSASRDAGGAIVNSSSLLYLNGIVSISSSTLSGNSAVYGGAIANSGPPSFNASPPSSGIVTIKNSTLSGNTATIDGGAIYNNTGTLNVSSSTMAGNHASTGGAIYNDFTTFLLGGNKYFGFMNIGGTIVAYSTGGNCGGAVTTTDQGYNLTDANGNCSLSGPTDLTGQDPMLGPLQNNGGPTQTMALLPGSPAIDRIPTITGLCPATDQRGAPRPDESEETCDIGAYESGATGPGSDHTPPTTTAHFSNGYTPGTWTDRAVTITLTATDNPGGSGVATTYYAIDTLSCTQANLAACSVYRGPITISTQGIHTLTYFSVDHAGNIEAAHQATIEIDLTPPTCTVTMTPSSIWPPNHKFVPVTATVTVRDTLSGPHGFILGSITSNEGDIRSEERGFVIGQPSTSGQFLADRLGNGTGRVYTLTYVAGDRAGNTATCSGTVRVPHDQGS